MAPLHFSTLSHKRHDFRKKVTEYKMYIFIFITTFIWNISHYKKNSARYYHKCENVFMWHTRYFCRIFNDNRIFSTDFRQKLKYQISQKSVQWEPTDGQRNGRTDGHDVDFRTFANAPKKRKSQRLNRHFVETLKMTAADHCQHAITL